MPILALIICTLPVICVAEELTLTVTDENGQPLANAVVTYVATAEPRTVTKRHQVVQQGREFVPNTTLIKQGDTVTFPNQDSLRHHVYSFSSTRTFEFELYGGDVSPSMDFPRSGLVVLGCNIHDDMIGYIMVDEYGQGGVTDTDGRLRFDAGDATEFTVWHGDMLEPGIEPVSVARSDFTQQQHEVRLPFTAAVEEKEESELERRFKGFGR
jgi:plastocyanin